MARRVASEPSPAREGHRREKTAGPRLGSPTRPPLSADSVSSSEETETHPSPPPPLASSPSPRAPEPMSALHQRYRVGRIIGKGGFAVVREGTRVRDGLRVAVKSMPLLVPGSRRRPPREIRSSSAEGDGSSARASPTKSSARRRPRASPVRRVACEARVLARLGAHPCVISALECFRGERDFAIVFELADRGDARAALDRRRRDGALMDEAEAWATLRPLASALAHAHSLGVAHGDVKPANLLFVDETLKLADFGLATEASEAESPSAATEARRRVGTPRYAAPEVCSPSPGAETEGSAFAADVWSLGCVFHELLTLRAPFDAECPRSRPEVATRAKRGETPRSTRAARPSSREGRDEDGSSEKSRGGGLARGASRAWDAAFSAIRRRSGSGAAWDPLPRGRFSEESRDLARKMLARDPRERPSAEAVAEACESAARRFAAADRTTVRDAQAALADAASYHRASIASEATGTRAEVSSGARENERPAAFGAGAAASLRASLAAMRERIPSATSGDDDANNPSSFLETSAALDALIDVLDDGARSDDVGARLIRYARVAAFAARALGRADLSDELTERVDEEAAATRRRVRGGGPTDTPRRVVSAAPSSFEARPAPSPPSSAPASLARVARGEASKRRLARAVMRAFEALGVDTRFASAHAVARARGWAADAALRDACEKALVKREGARSDLVRDPRDGDGDEWPEFG